MSMGRLFSENRTKDMRKNNINLDISIKKSYKAYLQASKEYNELQEDIFNKGEEKDLPPTLSSLILKDTHHQVFYTILSYYRERLLNLNMLFNGSTNIMTHINPKMSMYVKTGRIAKHLGRRRSTIRERLRRLEKAGIIQVVFHGHKRPIEIIFEKNTCLVYNKSDINSTIKSKFLKCSNPKPYETKGQKPYSKEGTLTEPIYNITITSDVLKGANSQRINTKTDDLQDFINIQSFQHDLKNTKKFSEPTEKITEPTEANRGTEKERKKVPQKKERKNKSLKEIRAERLEEKKQRSAYKRMTDAEKKRYNAEKKAQYKLNRPAELSKRKKDALIHYSLAFYGYLKENLFQDKYFTPHYRKEVLNYIAKHYFASAKSTKAMDNLLANYKKRVDISKKWIENYKGADGSKFDTTFFFPKAYLDIEKTYSKAFSFANTEKFIKQQNEWNKIKGYNTKTNEKLRHKLNKISRELENGFIDYDTALQKVKSLTYNSEEYVKQLNARYFGIYKS